MAIPPPSGQAAPHPDESVTGRHTRVAILCMRAVIALAQLALVPASARATTPIAEVICAPRAEIVQRLSVQYHAELSGTGVRDPDAIMEVWADPQGRWTLVQHNANGTSCILAMGEAWYTVDPA